MNELQIFQNKQFGQIRILEKDNEPWFVGKDVAGALGYERPTKAIQDHVDSEDRDEIPIQDSIGRMQKTPIINESGLYSLILSSKLPQAKEFKRWITSEVLPSIRKNGGYIMDQENLSDAELMARALLVAQKTIESRDKEIARMKPKEIFADAVSSAHTTILIGELAKLMRQNGVDIGQNRLFAWLRDNGFLIKRRGADWNTPTQKAMEMGLFEIKERTIHNYDGSVSIKKTTKVTGKGQIYFINKLLKQSKGESFAV